MQSMVLLVAMTLGLPAFAAQVPIEASALLGAVVLDAQGERLGTLRDLALDVEAGTVAYSIVEYDAPEPLRAELRPVPLTEFRPGLPRERLLHDPAAGAGNSARPRADARLLRGSTVLGMAIEHPSGADYGVIVDLRVDLQTARVLSALVQLDAAAGKAPLREVPFSALRFPPGSHTALLTLAR